MLIATACSQFPQKPQDNKPWGPPGSDLPATPAHKGDYGPDKPVDVSNVRDAVPTDVTPSKSGNPSSYTVLGQTYTLVPACKGYQDRGIASWYGMQFNGGRTSDGETYDMYAMTAANKVVPIPCYVRVTNLKSGKSVIVKINDRGPFVANRLIDLSYAAASKLGMLGSGTALVEVQAVGPGDLPPPADTAPAAATVVAGLPATTLAIPAAPSPPASGNPQIFLQVGAYAGRANADSAVTRLTAGGVSHAFVAPASDGARTLYKVRIGPLADVDSVDKLTAALAELGFKDAQIVIP
ncbi:MAG TPA: septal ring lytic transglycosylase RlpA family protein [Gammaproteobacteria bacterium]|nr:septal ring lytic transglycosylase RlpA family protein [Gammaproteobacteria bacterium]